MVLMFPFAQMTPKLKNLALFKLTRIFLLPILAFRWCWCSLSLRWRRSWRTLHSSSIRSSFYCLVLAFRWCWCSLSLAGNAEAEEPERAGDPLQDHQQRHDQRLQPVSGAHSNTGSFTSLTRVLAGMSSEKCSMVYFPLFSLVSEF